MPCISMPIHVCLRVHVSINWSDTCIKGVSYRVMLASFELYIGHMTYQHNIRQLEFEG